LCKAQIISPKNASLLRDANGKSTPYKFNLVQIYVNSLERQYKRFLCKKIAFLFFGQKIRGASCHNFFRYFPPAKAPGGGGATPPVLQGGGYGHPPLPLLPFP